MAFLPLICGCRTLKAPSTPSKEWTPPEWRQSLKKTDTVWESIRSQQIDTTKPLTMIELVDMALSNNPTTREAWQNARVKEMERKQAEGDWYPQVTATGDFTKQKKVAHPREDNLNTRNFGAQGQITYLLLDLGGRNARVKQASEMILAANFQFNQAIQDLLLDTETAYYTLYSDGASVEAAEADTEDAKKALESAQNRHEVGLVSKLDVLQAESNYNDALYSLEDAKGQHKIAKGNLAKIIGIPADVAFEIAPPSGKLPTEISKENVSMLIEQALERRPDIAASRAMLRAKGAAVKAANSDLWPTLNIGGSTEKRRYDYFGESKRHMDYYDYTGYLSVDWNVFDGFANYAKRQAAKRTVDMYREKLRQTELEASADVWGNYYNFNTAVKKLKYSEAFLSAAEASYSLAMDSYNAGLKGILDLLQAQSQLSDARSKLIESKKELFVSLTGLAHATGSLNTRDE